MFQDGEEDDDIRSSFTAEYLKSSSLIATEDSSTAPTTKTGKVWNLSSKIIFSFHFVIWKICIILCLEVLYDEKRGMGGGRTWCQTYRVDKLSGRQVFNVVLKGHHHERRRINPFLASWWYCLMKTGGGINRTVRIIAMQLKYLALPVHTGA